MLQKAHKTRKEHPGFGIENCGFVISDKHAILGATTDGWLICDCRDNL